MRGLERDPVVKAGVEDVDPQRNLRWRSAELLGIVEPLPEPDDAG